MGRARRILDAHDSMLIMRNTVSGDKPLQFKIVIDCAHGAYITAPQTLTKLGLRLCPYLRTQWPKQ